MVFIINDFWTDWWKAERINETIRVIYFSKGVNYDVQRREHFREK